MNVNEGETAKFTLKVSGKPKPAVKWFKEEEEIVITTTEIYEVIEEEDTVILVIKSAKTEHSGNYSAQLINEAGQVASNKATLTVNKAPVFVKVPDEVPPTNKEESIRLECTVEAFPKPNVNWFINGKELTAKDGVQIEKDVNNNKYALTIPKANPTAHSGLVTIKATNAIGSAQHELTLSILDVPKITGKVENVSVNEGMDAEFVAKFVSNPAPSKITWFKNDAEELVPGESVQVSSTNDTATLKLINCKSADTGSSYLVKIANALGEASSNKATLNVSSGPVFVQEPASLKVVKEKEAKFECIVKSNPKPNVIWMLNEKEFTNKDGVRIEKDAAKDKYTLIIPKATQAHIGNITVKATNEFGSAERTCQLDVLDGPKVAGKLGM